MKKKALGISLILSGFALTLGAFLVPSSKVKEAKGYSASSLPTTIDLKNSTDNEIRNYYSGVSGQGSNLLISLKNRLKNGQKYYSYENGTSIWQMYEITDRDWEKSPASSTKYGTYDASAQKITNYTYGTSSSSSKNNPYIHALYVNRNVTNQTDAWSDHQQTQWGINREHVWPKAEGFDTSGAGGARGDPMHLMAGNGYANNIHSNYYYGYVNLSSDYTNCGTKYSNLNGNYSGKSLTKGGTTTVFEPQDSDKGDIARSIFYMAARYNYLSGSDSDGIDSNNPNLALTSNLSDWSKSGYTSSKTTQGKLGIIEDLLAWHHADPVDEYEIHRNNLLYKNFTNNRNPFIDFPEWADFIWGKVTYNGRNYQSYSSTPTGSANPASDTINGYNSGGSSVSVTGVSLDKTSLSLYKGDTATLVATVSPSDATNKSVTWTSSNTSIVTVSNLGVVTAKAAGTATITVTTADGNKTATCTVTVNEVPATLSSISLSGSYKTTFDYGDDFSFGGTVTANFSNGTSQNVTSDAAFDGFDSTLVGNQTITVSYTFGGVTKSISYAVKINDDPSAESNAYLYSDEIDEGDYVIYYAGKALKNVVSSYNRFNYLEVNPIENVISDPDSSIVWHVEQTDNYWTIYNTAISKYAAGNGTANKGQLLSSNSSDYAKWTITFDSTKNTYEFVNKGNADDGVNSTLRNNGTYGFACYSSSTGGALSLYKIIRGTATSIFASVDKDYYVGETITKTDIKLKDNLGRIISDFDFDDYMFRYEDTVGGTESTEIDFDILYSNMETTFSATVSRKSYLSTYEYEIKSSNVFSEIGGSKTELLSGTVEYDGISFEYYKSYYFNGAISFGNASSQSGYFYNKTSLPYKICGINFAKSGRAVNAKVSLNGTSNWKLVSEADLDSNDYRYFRIDCIGNTGSDFSNIYTVTLTLDATKLAKPLANYVMYEDTDNQCTTKFSIAKGYFEGLSQSGRSDFMTSEDYVISTARERFLAWAKHEGKSIRAVGGDYVISSNNNISFISESLSTPTTFIIIISVLGVSALGGYLFIRRYKQK